MFKRIFCALFILVFFIFSVSFVRADELEDIANQLKTIQILLDESKKASAPNEESLRKVEREFSLVEGNIIALEQEIRTKEAEIRQGELDLVKQKEAVGQRVRSYYKQSKNYFSTTVGLLLKNGLSEGSRLYFYQQHSIGKDREALLKIAFFITTLEERKNTIALQLKQLAINQEKLRTQKNFFNIEVRKAKNYQGELQGKIAQLSARQQQILAQKLSSLGIPQSAYTTQGGCKPDFDINPGFSPRFAFASFGVPNRVGLNQYGALGRARAGQDYTQILQAYYNYDSINNVDTSIQIQVEGYGGYSLEEYVKRVYEVPDSWTDNNLAALKAQAVAARSYVLAYTNNGQGSICTTEQCQVFKPEPKGGNWEQAVNATSGQAMIQGGVPIKAWFSSTHGGYVFQSSDIGWSGTSWTKRGIDTPSGSVSSFEELRNNAYDRDSPWFYCDWGARAEYNKTAWLKSEEVADIANIILLVRIDSSTREHLYQLDKPNPAGTDNWDMSRVKEELRRRGGNPLNSINSVSVSADFGSGRTTNATINGDSGSVSVSGSEFKDFFNLRAPANINIVGPLFNVEQQ